MHYWVQGGPHQPQWSSSPASCNKLATFVPIQARPQKLQHAAAREQKRSKLSTNVKISEVAGELLNENARVILTSTRIPLYRGKKESLDWHSAETLPILNGTNNFLYEFLLFPLSHGKNKYEVSFHFIDFQNESLKIKSENKKTCLDNSFSLLYHTASNPQSWMRSSVS